MEFKFFGTPYLEIISIEGSPKSTIISTQATDLVNLSHPVAVNMPT